MNSVTFRWLNFIIIESILWHNRNSETGVPGSSCSQLLFATLPTNMKAMRQVFSWPLAVRHDLQSRCNVVSSAAEDGLIRKVLSGLKSMTNLTVSPWRLQGTAFVQKQCLPVRLKESQTSSLHTFPTSELKDWIVFVFYQNWPSIM